MGSHNVLFILAIICLIGAAFLYAGKDNSGIERFVTSINMLTGRTTKLEADKEYLIKKIDLLRADSHKQFETHMSIIEAYQRKISDLDREFKIMSSRYHSMDKRIAEKTKTVNMNFTKSIPVDIIQPQKKKKTNN